MVRVVLYKYLCNLRLLANAIFSLGYPMDRERLQQQACRHEEVKGNLTSGWKLVCGKVLTQIQFSDSTMYYLG